MQLMKLSTASNCEAKTDHNVRFLDSNKHFQESNDVDNNIQFPDVCLYFLLSAMKNNHNTILVVTLLCSDKYFNGYYR